MKNRILTKLRSRTGASITFALLLFLVCAVLSSVIIVAASAAAGRMSGIAEADQRYYAVTSAAELLRDLLDGKSASIVKADFDSDGTDETYMVEKGADVITEKEGNWALAGPLYIPGGSLLADAAYYADSGVPSFKRTLQSSDEAESDPLAVDIDGIVNDGTMKLQVANQGDKKYTLTLSFAAEESEKTKSIYKTDGTERVKAEITTLTWKLVEIKTGTEE